MNSVLPLWVIDAATILSIVGFILTCFLLWEARKIRKSFYGSQCEAGWWLVSVDKKQGKTAYFTVFLTVSKADFISTL